MLLNIHVTFTAGHYHGAEWPPSPARLFQALVAATHRGAYGLIHAEVRDRALAWLETLAAPVIFAPNASISGVDITNYVPNNDDGGTKDLLPHVKAAKPMQLRVLPLETKITYSWVFDPAAGGAANADVISAMTPLATYLGRTVDLVYARGEIAESGNPGNVLAWIPNELNDGPWQMPKPGFLKLCQERYPHSVSKQPPDFTNSQQIDYANTDMGKAAVPVAVVELLKPSGEFHRFNARSLRIPAGMVRDAFRTWLSDYPVMEQHYGSDRVARLLFGHKSAGVGTPSEGGHVAAVPLPSLNATHTADGLIRRVLIVGWGIRHQKDQDLFAQAVQGLNGRALRDRGREVGELRLLSQSERTAQTDRWFGRSGARVWRSVTPVVLPGYSRKSRSSESYLVRALAQQGFAVGAIDSVASFSGPLIPSTLPAQEYRVADYLRTTPRVHAEIIFKMPVLGPLVVGRGRFAGLGLFLPIADSGETAAR